MVIRQKRLIDLTSGRYFLPAKKAMICSKIIYDAKNKLLDSSNRHANHRHQYQHRNAYRKLAAAGPRLVNRWPEYYSVGDPYEAAFTI